MEVRKRAPNVLRVAGTSVRIAERGIRTSQCHLKKGLTASVIGAEENEEEGNSRKSDLFIMRNRYSRRTVQERYRQKQKEQAEVGKALEKESACKSFGKNQNGAALSGKSNGNRNSSTGNNIYGNRDGSGYPSSEKNRSVVFQPFKIKSVLDSSQEGTASGKGEENADRNRNQSATFVKKGSSAGKKAGKAAGRAAVGAAAGAATGGVSVALYVALKAAETAVAAAKKTKESLQASVIKGEAGEETQRSGQSPGGKGLIALAAVSAIVPSLLIAALILPLLFLGSVITLEPLNGANRIVAVARAEVTIGDREEDLGGQKYKEWYGMDADWCAIFVSWCADQCGYINMGIMPKTASVDSMKDWYEERNLYHTKESGYEPMIGDIVFFGNGMSHVGIVAEYDSENGIVTTIEGNTGASYTTPYHMGSRVKECWYPLTYDQIVGYAAPEYPLMEVEIPEPYGTEYSYMGWQMITSVSSRQYQLREEAGMNFDENGFGKIGDRYVIACTTTFGQVGDYIDWELDNGTVIKTVIGDIKNQNDEGCNEWGHHNGLCVVEFVVDKDTWYGAGWYPTDFHSEWEGRTIRATKVGSFW